MPVHTLDMVRCRSVHPAKQTGHQGFNQEISRDLQTPCASRYILCDYWTVYSGTGVGEKKGQKGHH